MKISLRDHFAGLAMQTLMTLDHGEWTPEEISAAAYAQADAMVGESERAKSQPRRLDDGAPANR